MKITFAILATIVYSCGTSSAQTPNTNRDASVIGVYITPFYNSEGPQINAGAFSLGLSSTNEAQFAATIREMKRTWASLTFVELYVAAIRLYDMGFRKESVYWFYSAQYRGRLYSALLDKKQISGDGSEGIEFLNTFHQLVGPYINSYAACDTNHWIETIQRVKEECKKIPSMKGSYPTVAFLASSKWAEQNEQLRDGLEELLTAVKEQAAELKRKRIESGVEDQFCKLSNKDFPEMTAKVSAEINHLLEHLKAMEKAKKADRMEQDRHDLIELGVFEKREFQLKSKLFTEQTVPEFTKMVSKTSFINDNWALIMPATNSRTITVTSHCADMPAWEKLIIQFDSQKQK